MVFYINKQHGIFTVLFSFYVHFAQRLASHSRIGYYTIIKNMRPLRPLRVQLSQRESPWQNRKLCMDCQSLPLWGRWHCASNDGEGEDAK